MTNDKWLMESKIQKALAFLTPPRPSPYQGEGEGGVDTPINEVGLPRLYGGGSYEAKIGFSKTW